MKYIQLRKSKPANESAANDELAAESYSQSGEDLIIKYVSKNHLGIDRPSYLDIGAYDPVVFSNTYLFYKLGAKGVLVEPDRELAKKIRDHRPRDRVLNVGVSDKSMTRNFYLVSPATLNTFSKEEFEQYKIFYPGTTLRKVVPTKIVSINSLIEKYFKNGLDLLSIDVEGLDYKILSSINLKRCRPSVISIETVKYENNDTWTKPKDIASFMYKNSYFLYADTFINSIFVDKKKWLDNKQPKLKNFEGR